MKNKMLIAATLFAVTSTGAFAQDLLLANSGYAESVKSSDAATDYSEVMAMAPSAITPKVNHGKTREQVREELAEYNRENPRGYLYSYYLVKVIGQQ